MKQITTIIFALICAASFGQRDLGQKFVSFPDTVYVQTDSCCCKYKSYVANITSDEYGDLTVTVLENTTGHVIEWFYDSVGNWYATGFTEDRNEITLTVSPDVGYNEKFFAAYSNNLLIIGYVNIVGYYDCINVNGFSTRNIEVRIYP